MRIWHQPRVKVGGRYRMDDGHIVVDSIVPIALEDVTDDLARQSGFASVEDLVRTAKHGAGESVFLVRFHYLAPGAWDEPQMKHNPAPLSRSRPGAPLLTRIRRSAAPATPREREGLASSGRKTKR